MSLFQGIDADPGQTDGPEPLGAEGPAAGLEAAPAPRRAKAPKAPKQPKPAKAPKAPKTPKPPKQPKPAKAPKAPKQPKPAKAPKVSRKAAKASALALAARGETPPNPFHAYAEGAKRRKFRLSAKDKAVWLTTLAQQVTAGLTPQESLSTLGGDADAGKRRQGSAEASAFADEMIDRGFSFADALEMAGVLDAAAITAIRAGHQSGKLGLALTQSAQRMERAYKLKSKIRGAMAMPAITIVVAFAIAGYVILEIVPVLGGVFSSLGHGLPLLTRILVNLSHTLPAIAGSTALCLAALYAAYRAARRNGRWAIALDRAKLRAPIVGKMLHDSQMANVLQTLGLLMSTGIISERALESAAGTTGNAALRDVFGRAARSAQDTGTRLSSFLAGEDLIPRTDVALIRAGEKSGSTYEGVEKAADFHFISSDERTQQVADTINPVLTLLVGGIVGMVVLGVYLPMFQMYGLLGSGI